jgi:uncharacterized protein (TIGR03435 family)
MSHRLRSLADNRPGLALGVIVPYGVVAYCTAAAVAFAQAPALDSQKPAFEVSTVKRNVSGDTRGESVFQSDRYMARNVRVHDLIAEAYRVRTFQISGGPDWIRSDRFDIVAKAASSAPLALINGPNGVRQPSETPFVMLRGLLNDRFKLAVHTESREGPIYELVMARDDSRNGPQLRPPATDCAKLDPAGPPPPGGFCGGIRTGIGRMTGKSAPMRQLASVLSGVVQRQVVDRTNLPGLFDFDLAFSPMALNADAADVAASVDGGISLFTALQEQLGVKLQPQRGPIDYLVIDRVEPPTEN